MPDRPHLKPWQLNALNDLIEGRLSERPPLPSRAPSPQEAPSSGVGQYGMGPGLEALASGIEKGLSKAEDYWYKLPYNIRSFMRELGTVIDAPTPASPALKGMRYMADDMIMEGVSMLPALLRAASAGKLTKSGMQKLKRMQEILKLPAEYIDDAGHLRITSQRAQKEALMRGPDGKPRLLWGEELERLGEGVPSEVPSTFGDRGGPFTSVGHDYKGYIGKQGQEGGTAIWKGTTPTANPQISFDPHAPGWSHIRGLIGEHEQERLREALHSGVSKAPILPARLSKQIDKMLDRQYEAFLNQINPTHIRPGVKRLEDTIEQNWINEVRPISPDEVGYRAYKKGLYGKPIMSLPIPSYSLQDTEYELIDSLEHTASALLLQKLRQSPNAIPQELGPHTGRDFLKDFVKLTPRGSLIAEHLPKEGSETLGRYLLKLGLARLPINNDIHGQLTLELMHGKDATNVANNIINLGAQLKADQSIKNIRPLQFTKNNNSTLSFVQEEYSGSVEKGRKHVASALYPNLSGPGPYFVPQASSNMDWLFHRSGEANRLRQETGTPLGKDLTFDDIARRWNAPELAASLEQGGLHPYQRILAGIHRDKGYDSLITHRKNRGYDAPTQIFLTGQDAQRPWNNLVEEGLLRTVYPEEMGGMRDLRQRMPSFMERTNTHLQAQRIHHRERRPGLEGENVENFYAPIRTMGDAATRSMQRWVRRQAQKGTLIPEEFLNLTPRPSYPPLHRIPLPY